MTRKDSLVDVIRVLLLVEAGIAVVMSIEALFSLAFAGPAAVPIAVLGLVGATTAFILVRGVGRRSRVARKVTLWLQAGILLVALIDSGLAIVVAQRGLELVPTLTRVVLPISIFVLLRRDPVRREFGLMTRVDKKARKRELKLMKRIAKGHVEVAA